MPCAHCYLGAAPWIGYKIFTYCYLYFIWINCFLWALLLLWRMLCCRFSIEIIQTWMYGLILVYLNMKSKAIYIIIVIESYIYFRIIWILKKCVRGDRQKFAKSSAQFFWITKILAFGLGTPNFHGMFLNMLLVYRPKCRYLGIRHSGPPVKCDAHFLTLFVKENGPKIERKTFPWPISFDMLFVAQKCTFWRSFRCR